MASVTFNLVHSNQKGHERPFLPEPYNWKTYGEMNVAFLEEAPENVLRRSDQTPQSIA